MTKTERLNKYKVDGKNPKGPVKRLYTVHEAAYYLGRTVNALWQIIWDGKIITVRDGRRVLLDVKDMDDYIERNKPALPSERILVDNSVATGYNIEEGDRIWKHFAVGYYS